MAHAEPGHQLHRAGRYHTKAIVEYDGTEYLGFQIQCRGKTIQGEIERALAEIAGCRTRIVGAGRTDAGVHAKGQVIGFVAEWNHPLSDMRRALNAKLPQDIAIVELEQAAPGFHPRYSARSREYTYTIYDRAVRSPLVSRYAYHCARPLDAETMGQACGRLVGTHDFLPFGWPPRGQNTVRTVFRSGCERTGEFVRVTVEANAFLRRMMRRVVGNLVLVGLGKLSAEDFAGLLSLKHRQTPGGPLPPQGLCLVNVNY
jgi:tRNA pseudouridine38-40 synthase